MRKVLAVVGIVVLVVLVLAVIGTGLVVSRFGVAPGVVRGFGFRPFVFGAIGLGWLGLMLRLLVWAVIIGGVILLAGWVASMIRQPVVAAPSRETPLDILKMRYARGEITKEQYDQLRHDLEA